MIDKAKAPIIILTVLILVSLSLAGGLFYLLRKEQVTNVSLQQQLNELKTQEKLTAQNLMASKKMVSELEIQLQDAQNKLSNLNSDLENERRLKAELLKQIDAFKAGLAREKEASAGLEGELNQAREDMKKLQAQVEQYGTRNVELEDKIKELEKTQHALREEKQDKSVELGTVMVTPEGISSGVAVSTGIDNGEGQGRGGIEPALEGKVLVINKDYNFVVIDLGSKDGVNIGDVYSVYRDNKHIGDIKIEKTHESMSAAEFLSPGIKDKVREGDTVFQKAK